jgi:hypothetical protein
LKGLCGYEELGRDLASAAAAKHEHGNLGLADGESVGAGDQRRTLFSSRALDYDRGARLAIGADEVGCPDVQPGADCEADTYAPDRLGEAVGSGARGPTIALIAAGGRLRSASPHSLRQCSASGLIDSTSLCWLSTITPGRAGSLAQFTAPGSAMSQWRKACARCGTSA